MRKRKAFLVVGLVLLLLGIAAWQCGGIVEPPTPTPTLAPTPTSTPEPTRPEGYESEFDQDLRLSFMRPSGWDAEKGSQTLPVSKATILFVGYHRLRAGEYKVVSLAMLEEPQQGPLEGMIEAVLDLRREEVEEAQVDILERLSDVTIDGEPSTGMVYRATDPRGVRFFSIVLATMTDERSYIFQWASGLEYEDETRQICETMLPTIEFID